MSSSRSSSSSSSSSYSSISSSVYSARAHSVDVEATAVRPRPRAIIIARYVPLDSVVFETTSCFLLLGTLLLSVDGTTTLRVGSDIFVVERVCTFFLKNRRERASFVSNTYTSNVHSSSSSSSRVPLSIGAPAIGYEYTLIIAVATYYATIIITITSVRYRRKVR
jgi:hypothetical protein